MIQIGRLLLIATPVAQSLAFASQHDFTYKVVTLIFLAVLVYSIARAYPSGGG